MRNHESKIDSFSILLTILLGFDSGIDSKKKSKIGQRTGIGIEKESDSTQHYSIYVCYLAGDAVVPRREAAEVRDGGVRGEGGRLPACE